MSVDPDPASAQSPTPPKNPTDSAGESSDPLRLKRRFKKGGSESEEGENPDQTIQLLSTLLQDLIAKKGQPPTPEAEAAKTAKYHRLSKTGGGVPVPSSEPADPTASAPPTTATGTVAPPATKFRPAPVSDSAQDRKRLRRWKTLCVLGILASGAATYFLVTYLRPATPYSASSGKTPAGPVVAWNDASLRQLDQALAADQAGDTRGALRIASALQTPGTPPLPGLVVYLAGLQSRLEHTYDAEADLLRVAGTTSSQDGASVNEGLAFNFSRIRDFEKAGDYHSAASRQNPFSASLYYHWGEGARHLGHFADALVSFRRALDRVPTGQPENESLRECIGLKMRLCNVEEGQEAKFQPDLAEHLKASMPSGYWLLTAAASALQRNNMPEAVGFLGRARDALGKDQFDALLNDYFFRAFADRKELADFFPSDPAARRAKLLPTMTYTIEP